MAKVDKDLIADVFVTDNGKPYLQYTTDIVGDIEFANITGKGIKLNPKNKYNSYKVSMVIDKKEAKRLRSTILALWDEFKPRGADEEPANFKSLVYDHDDGRIFINPHARVENEDGKKVNIGIVDGELNKLDPEVFGKIGKGSTGYVSVNLTTYDEGISMYLNGLQIEEFVPYAGGSGDGTRGFSKKEGAKALATDGNSFQRKSEKEKKKKKEKKKSSDDE
jgi:hypothetical protein